MSFFLGSFASGLAKELDNQRKAKQQQEEQQLRQLQMQAYLKQLQGQQEISGLSGLGFTPPGGFDMKQPTPVGDDMGDQPPSLGRSLMRSQAPLLGGSGNDPRNKIPVIRADAEKYGVDPDLAVQIFSLEGLGNPVGDRGTSFGAPQLHVGGGMGDDFQRDTGLDPRNWRQNEDVMIDYALKRASTGGWGPWSAARNMGITGFEGIKRPDQTNLARMGPVDTSPQARAEGARELGIPPTQAQYSGPGAGFLPQATPQTAPQGMSPAAPAAQGGGATGGPDTYNRAVQEVLRARQQVQETLRRAPNATVQQRKAVLDEWDKQAKEWLGGIKEQNARAAEQGRYERGRADEERRFERDQAAKKQQFQESQAAEQRRHERNIEEQGKELGTGGNFEITDKEGKVLWQGVAREGKKGGLFDEGGNRLDTQFKDAKITKLPTSQQLIGSRENVLIQRSLTSGIEITSELENVTKLPIGASSGPFGGRKQGPGLVDATKERLANWFTPLNDKFYNTSIAGLGREIGGLVNSGVYINQHTIDTFKQLEFQTTDEPEVKLHKLATLRQNTENALQSVLVNPRVAKEQKDFAHQMIDRLKVAIPFTPGDVIGWANSGDPNQTIGQYIKQSQLEVEEGKGEKLGGQQSAPSSGVIKLDADGNPVQ